MEGSGGSIALEDAADGHNGGPASERADRDHSPSRRRRRKVLFLSAAYRKRGIKASAGGVATHVESLAHSLASSEQYLVDVVCGGRVGGEATVPLQLSRRRTLELSEGAIEVFRVPHFETPTFDPRRVIGQEIIEFLIEGWRDEHAPDLIHAHDFDSIYYGSVVAIALDVPLVVTMHRAVIEPKTGTSSNAKEAYMRLLAKRGVIDHMVVPSNASLKAMEGRGFSGQKLGVIYHGLSAKHLASICSDINVLRNAGLADDDRFYICPVRADEHKDPSVVIRMAADLLKESEFAGSRFVLTISKEDPLFQDLHSIAEGASLCVGKDILFSTFDKQEMATIYRSARACIVPSPDESFGQTVLEAFVYRCPVIAANSAALKEVVRHEVNGLHFDVRNSDDLKRHLIRLETSPTLRQKLIQTAERDVMTKFNAQRMASDHRKVYSVVWQRHTKKK